MPQTGPVRRAVPTAWRGAQVGHALPGGDPGSDMGSRPASMDFGFGAPRRTGPVGASGFPAAAAGPAAGSRPASLDYQRAAAPAGRAGAPASVAGHALGSDLGSDAGSRPASLDYGPRAPPPASLAGHAIPESLAGSDPASLGYQRAAAAPAGAPSVAGHAVGSDSGSGSRPGSFDFGVGAAQRPVSLAAFPVAGSELGSDVGAAPAGEPTSPRGLRSMHAAPAAGRGAPGATGAAPAAGVPAGARASGDGFSSGDAERRSSGSGERRLSGEDFFGQRGAVTVPAPLPGSAASSEPGSGQGSPRRQSSDSVRGSACVALPRLLRVGRGFMSCAVHPHSGLPTLVPWGAWLAGGAGPREQVIRAPHLVARELFGCSSGEAGTRRCAACQAPRRRALPHSVGYRVG